MSKYQGRHRPAPSKARRSMFLTATTAATAVASTVACACGAAVTYALPSVAAGDLPAHGPQAGMTSGASTVRAQSLPKSAGSSAAALGATFTGSHGTVPVTPGLRTMRTNLLTAASAGTGYTGDGSAAVGGVTAPARQPTAEEIASAGAAAGEGESTAKTGDSGQSTTFRSAPSEGHSTTSGWTCVIAGCGGVLTSGFGPRVAPGGIGSTYHLGDDFAVPVGTPLHSVHAGTVIAIGWDGGLGQRIQVDVGDRTSVIYGHLSAVAVRVGDRVREGQVVAYSGDTGISTGPHVHVEIHVDGRPVDPTPWLRARGIFPTR